MKDLIENLKAAAAKATPGPWITPDLSADIWNAEKTNCIARISPRDDYSLGATSCRLNSNYIALCSPENILALCEALDEARELLQGLTEFHPDSCAYFQGSECDCFLGAKHQQAGQKARAWLKKYGSSN